MQVRFTSSGTFFTLPIIDFFQSLKLQSTGRSCFRLIDSVWAKPWVFYDLLARFSSQHLNLICELLKLTKLVTIGVVSISMP